MRPTCGSDTSQERRQGDRGRPWETVGDRGRPWETMKSMKDISTYLYFFLNSNQKDFSDERSFDMFRQKAPKNTKRNKEYQRIRKIRR